MKPLLGVVLALVLLRVQGRKPRRGDCVDEYCVTVHVDVADFNSAQKNCNDHGGHLMTVRTIGANRVISDLLTGHPGNFWIGLRYTTEQCPGSDRALKGFTWITGDEATNFTNWKTQERVCSPTCASVSKEDLKWTERHCDQTIQGFLCEYENTNKCTGLSSKSTVLYETPFGFTSQDLQDVPSSSNATVQDVGTRLVCVEGSWFQAPWNCEVYKGGCDHECQMVDDVYTCTCFPGYELEGNAVGCAKAHNDPCKRANCSQQCLVKGQNYACQCFYGYELGRDGKTCRPVDNCGPKRLCPEESSYCVSTTGGYECHCKNGFIKDQDVCVDDNECFSGPCEHSCNNTIGGYFCECSEGYKVSPEDKHACVLHCEEWECPVVHCDINNPDQCYCPDGYILNEGSSGKVCSDIDECDESPCDEECQNTPGDYICSCKEGFHLVHGTKCVPTDRLSTTTSIGMFPPTSRSPPFENEPVVSAGGICGIIVCTVLVPLLIVCIIYHNMKRCRNITKDKDVHALQQVKIEKHV